MYENITCSIPTFSKCFQVHWVLYNEAFDRIRRQRLHFLKGTCICHGCDLQRALDIDPGIIQDRSTCGRDRRE